MTSRSWGTVEMVFLLMSRGTMWAPWECLMGRARVPACTRPWVLLPIALPHFSISCFWKTGKFFLWHFSDVLDEDSLSLLASEVYEMVQVVTAGPGLSWYQERINSS